MDDRKYRGGATNPESQREHRGGREERRKAKLPDCVPERARRISHTGAVTNTGGQAFGLQKTAAKGPSLRENSVRLNECQAVFVSRCEG